MSVTAKVEFAMELSEKEYEVILALRAMDEVRREIIMTHIEQIAIQEHLGLSGKEVARRLEKWRENLSAEELAAMTQALQTVGESS
jgi:Fe2+ transport system protein B